MRTFIDLGTGLYGSYEGYGLVVEFTKVTANITGKPPNKASMRA